MRNTMKTTLSKTIISPTHDITPPSSPIMSPKKQITPVFESHIKQQKEDRERKAAQKKVIKSARKLKLDSIG